jgi:hypothetical protein
MNKTSTMIAAIAAMTMSSAAYAAQSDYFIKIDGIDGEAVASDWSFDACDGGACTTVKSPRDVASGQATGRRLHKPTSSSAPDASSSSSAASRTTYDLKANKGARSASGVQVAVGDLDGDGLADLAYAASLDEVSSFSLTFANMSGAQRKVCGGKHIASAKLRAGADSFDITGATIACYASEGVTMASGPRQSSDVASTAAVGSRATKQKQWLPANFRVADMGPGCASGQCSVTMVLTGGSMKHNKTGHVTLMK